MAASFIIRMCYDFSAVVTYK